MMDKDELKQFWRFVERRQRAWWRKEVKGRPAPYSIDPIIQVTHFTNMYRELDPGTQFVKMMRDAHISNQALAFWILFYRYTGSNYRVMENIKLVETTKYNEHRIINQMRKYDNPFGNAYLVYPMTNERTGKDKVQLVVEAFGEIADVWQSTWWLLQDSPEAEEAYKIIRSARKGIGPFSAFQTWVDYCMLRLIKDYRNEWVMPGPGAIRGASILWGEELSARAAAGACHHLWLKHIQQWHDRLKLKPHWRAVGHPLYLSDVQNALCEFQKYVRVRDTGKVTRGYVPR